MNMTHPILFAASPEMVSWLTPIWLLGVGAWIGIGLLLVLWGVFFGLSKIPFLGKLADTRRATNLVAGTIAAAITVVSLPIVIWRGFPVWYEQGMGEAIFNPFFALLVVGLIATGIGYALVALVSRRTMTELGTTIAEGPLLWIFVVVGSLALLGVVCQFVVEQPGELIESVWQIPTTGRETHDLTIVAATRDASDVTAVSEQTFGIAFPGRLLRSFEFESSEPLELSATPVKEREFDDQGVITVSADEKMVWLRAKDDTQIIPNEDVSEIYIRNLGQSAATLKLVVHTAPEHPEVLTIPVTALSIVMIVLMYVVQRSMMPKLAAIALSTAKSEIAEPLFLILMIVISVGLVISIYVPYNTFGEDIKMLKNIGLQFILISGIFVAVWAAAKSISEEIEGRTALTVLSKPIARRDFIIGKFLGISWSLALLFIVLGVVFLIVVAYKPVYDEYEGGGTVVEWQICHMEMIIIVPGLVLAFMEVVVMAALSVAFSTRMPMLANFLTCMMVYVLGHLTPLMVQSSLNQFEIVTFVARLIATIFPVLDHFNIQAAVAGGAAVPLAYLQWSLLYCGIYATIAMLLALVMFEDRDLA